MNSDRSYDVAIVGGGLAGLALSIQCARQGYRTILFEKEKYPFHKVCGEYISFESWNFLEDLGVPLGQMKLPKITRLVVTAPNGKELRHDLPLGGFRSFESWNFLEDLGVPLGQMKLPKITRLVVTAPNGKELRHDLPLGGF